MAESEDMQEQVIDQAQALAPLGEVLLSARLARKLTLQDASANLRYSVRQIEALENNEFSALPEPMITRGFIRNYARYLALDAEPLLASYRERVPDGSHNEISVKSTVGDVSLTQDSQPWLQYILSSIVVLLFLLAWFFYMDNLQKHVDPVAEKVLATHEAAVELAPVAEETLPEAALPAAERQADAGAGAEAVAATSLINAELPATAPVAVVSPPPAGSAFSNEVKKELVPVVVAKQAANSQIADNQSQLDAGENDVKKTLGISVTDKTWVSVTDRSGKVVFEKMLLAGNAEAIDAMPPLNVVIGNVKASKLTYAGQSVDLTTQAGSNVARLRLE